MHLNSGILSLVAAVLCWGLAIPLSKSLLADFDPGVLMCIQLGASVSVLVATALVTRTRLTFPVRASWLLLMLVGTLEPGVAYYLEFVGLQSTTALHASVILTLEPMGILILNIVFFHFRRDIKLLLAAAAAAIGVIIVVFGSGEHGGRSSLYGDMIVFLGTMAASLYVSLSTQRFQSESVLSLLLIQQVSSLALVVLVSALCGSFGHAPSHPAGAELLGAGTVGILQFALAFLFYFHGVRKVSGYLGVIVLNLTPIVGITAAVLLLEEALSPLYVAGGVLCLAASLYTGFRERAFDQGQGISNSEDSSRQSARSITSAPR